MKRKTLAAALVLAASIQAGCVIIDDGEVGVSKSFGNISETPVSPGVAIVIPIARQVEVWNVKLQELKENARVPSSEGLIVGLDTSLLFQVLAEQAPNIRSSVGRDYEDVLIKSYFRNAMRDVVAGYPVRKIYSDEGRKEIAARIREFLRKNLDPRGIQVVDVLLRDVELPQRFRESIEAKLTAEQKVQQKQFELEQARKEAEIEVARAEGAAQAQRIVRSTLSDSYLQYLWIKTLNENPNVIYVATESNLPIFKSVSGGRR